MVSNGIRSVAVEPVFPRHSKTSDENWKRVPSSLALCFQFKAQFEVIIAKPENVQNYQQSLSTFDFPMLNVICMENFWK